ncbi:MAG: SDR family oxidoreductase [Pseudomonadota bacterium]
MRVLIAGATGKTGLKLAEELAANSHTPIALVREGSDTSALPEGCETRHGDLTDLPMDIAEGVDAVVFAAGSGSSTGKEMTKKVDEDGAKALVDAAERAGVERFVMLSSIGVDAPEEGPEAMQPYLKAKRAADDYLRASSLTETIVRPVALTDEPGTGHVIAKASVDPKTEISRDDVAHVLAVCLDQPEARHTTFELTSGEMPITEAVQSLTPTPMPSARPV